MSRWIICAAGLLLAACGVSSNTPAPPQRNPPTLAAPGWSEAVEPVTSANASNITLLGRLDQPETSSTLFDHALSPDATRLAALSNEEVLAWDLLTGQLIFRTARSGYTRLFYASDKTKLYAVDSAARVTVLDAETGSAENALAGHAHYAGVLAFDPENDRIAFGGRDGTVKIWELFERTALATFNAHDAPLSALAFSPDGARLATASRENAVRLWDWSNREQLDEFTLTVGSPQRLTFAPDGEQVAVGTEAGVWLWSLNGSTEPRLLSGHGGGAADLLAYSADGSFIVGGTRAGGLALWNTETGQYVDALEGAQGRQISADFSPDGAMLLTSALGGGVSLWNLMQPDQQAISRAQLPLASQQIYAVDWTDDGRLLLLFDATGPVYAWGIG